MHYDPRPAATLSTPESRPPASGVLPFVLLGAAACAAVGVTLGLTGLGQVQYRSLPPISHALLLGLYAAAVGGAVGGACAALVNLLGAGRADRGKTVGPPGAGKARGKGGRR